MTYFGVVLLCLVNGVCVAQQNYRTRASGDWNNPATWSVESPNGSNVWIAASSFPTSSDGTIAILGTTTVTVTANVVADQLTVNPNGSLILNDGVALTLNDGVGSDLLQLNSAVIRLLGESYIDGTGSAQFAGSVYVHSTNAAGAITAGAVNGGNIRNSFRAYGANTTLFYAGTAQQFIGNGHPSAVGMTTVINNPAGVALNSTSTSSITFNGNVNILNGQLTVENDDIAMNAYTLTLDGGNLVFNSTTSRFNTLNNVNVINGNIIVNGGAQSLNLTFRGSLVLSQGSISVSHNGVSTTGLNFNGGLAVNGGSTAFNATAGNLVVTFNSDITGNQAIMFSGPHNVVRVNGSGVLSNTNPFAAGSVFKSLEINRTGLSLTLPSSTVTALRLTNGTLALGANLTVGTTLDLAAGGVLDISGYQLRCNGIVNGTLNGGSIRSNSTSALLFEQSGSIGSFGFTNGSSLGTLTINRFGRTLNINSNVTITSALNLTVGTVNNISGLSMASGSTINRANLGVMTGVAPLGGPYNVVYATGATTTGAELAGPVGNITINSWGAVTLGTAVNATGNFTINSGSVVCGANSVTVGSITNATTFNAPSTSLSLTGNISNNGQFSAGTSGTINFNGGGALQSISGNSIQFNNINVSASSSISFASQHSLRGRLTMSSGSSIDADGAANTGRLTLLSSSENGSDNASIGTIPDDATVIGDFTVQRFVSAIDDTHRFISSPITNATVAQIQDDYPVTGGFTGTSFPCTGCLNNGSSMFWFQESLGGTFNSRYTAIPAVNQQVMGTNQEVLVPGRGYDLYIWNGAVGTRIDFTGQINRGIINYGNLTHTSSTPANAATDGWHLLGNPYPSAIDWTSATGWARSNIDPTVWVWDQGASVWRSYHLQNGGNLPGGLIASGQGFWVRANAGGGSLSLNEAAKTSSSASYYRTKSDGSSLGLKISLSNSTVSDETYLLINERASDSFDEGIDSSKPRVGIESVSIATVGKGGEVLGYAFVSELPTTVPLSVLTNQGGDHVLDFQAIGITSIINEYELWDIELDKVTSLDKPYKFATGSNENKNRFVLRKVSSEGGLESSRTIDVFPNPVNDYVYILIKSDIVKDLSLVNGLGSVIASPTFESKNGVARSTMHFSAMDQGVYFLRVVFADGTTAVHKIVKQ